MYESPIEIIYKDIANGLQIKMENDICTALSEYSININRDELIKALAYDRNQYEKGYSEGHIDGFLKAEKLYARPIGRWILQPHGYYVCSLCEKGMYKSNFCPSCGADMRGENND